MFLKQNESRAVMQDIVLFKRILSSRNARHGMLQLNHDLKDLIFYFAMMSEGVTVKSKRY